MNWSAATLKEGMPRMTLKEAIQKIEDLIAEFPDDILIEALEEMEDRAHNARVAKDEDAEDDDEFEDDDDEDEGDDESETEQ